MPGITSQSVFIVLLKILFALSRQVLWLAIYQLNVFNIAQAKQKGGINIPLKWRGQGESE
jgi:hypothetical protein